jgi:hypothetical protein
MQKFTQSTPNTINQSKNNYNVNTPLNKSFEPNKPLIEQNDNINKGELLHNNVNEKVLLERVVDYRINIHTKDRDISRFPSIFDMKVSLGNSNFTAKIEKSFNNVKYVTLNYITLPRTMAIDVSNIDVGTSSYNIYPTSSSFKSPAAANPLNIMYTLNNHPYLILKVSELVTDNYLGTNSLIDRDSFIIYPDQNLGDMYGWKPKRTTIVFPNSALGNLSKLSLQLFDEQGNKLSIYDQLGNDIMATNITGTTTKFNAYVSAHDTVTAVNYTNNMTQILYDFTVGIIENEINTCTSFN